MLPTYDIELLDWEEPVALGFFDGSNYYEFLKMSEDTDVVENFLTFLQREKYMGIKIYAHRAKDCDNKFVLRYLYNHGQKVSFTGGTARLTWNDLAITFEDSYSILTKGLAACCEAFGVERKLYWDHDTTRPIWEMMERLDAFRAYLKRDVLSLSEVMDEYVKTLLTTFGILPSLTMPLTAAKAFNKKFYPVKNIVANEKYEQFIRSATYGGRNEVFNRYGDGVYLYDIRSMYTSCYDTPVPIGKMSWTTPNIDKPCIAEARVKVPKDTFIGPLPYRINVGGLIRDRLTFPVGEFQDWWPTRELKMATEMGADIKIIRQLECDEEPILKEFGEAIVDLRDKAPNDQMASIWKLFGVRLSGKFGQRRIMTEINHIESIEDLSGWRPLDDQEVYFERSFASLGNRSPYIKPAINMTIRAEARCRHIQRLMEAHNKGTLYYCDNDSVFSSVPLFAGTHAGELQMIDYATEAYFVRCQFYGYENTRGAFKQKTSGYRDFKLEKSDFRRLLEGEVVQNNFKSLSGWKSCLQEEGLKLVDHHRSVKKSRRFENRVPHGLTTLPLELSTNGDGVVQILNYKGDEVLPSDEIPWQGEDFDD